MALAARLLGELHVEAEVATIFSVPSEMSRSDSKRMFRQMPTWTFFGLHSTMAVWSPPAEVLGEERNGLQQHAR